MVLHVPAPRCPTGSKNSSSPPIPVLPVLHWGSLGNYWRLHSLDFLNPIPHTMPCASSFVRFRGSFRGSGSARRCRALCVTLRERPSFANQLEWDGNQILGLFSYCAVAQLDTQAHASGRKHALSRSKDAEKWSEPGVPSPARLADWCDTRPIKLEKFIRASVLWRLRRSRSETYWDNGRAPVDSCANKPRISSASLRKPACSALPRQKCMTSPSN